MTEEDDVTQVIQRLKDLPQLRDAWREIELPAGATLFTKGDPGDAFYTVVSGELEVYAADRSGRKMVFEHLEPGEHVGELALIDGGLRAASVAAIAPSRLKMLRRDDFLAALGVSHELAAITIHMLGTRMRRTSGYLDLVTRWARQVTRGEYQEASASIQSSAADQDDPNFALFSETFTEMLSAVQAREAELKRELQDLRIEIDEQKYQRQISEITDSDFFQDLQVNAQRMRSRVHGRSDPEGSG